MQIQSNHGVAAYRQAQVGSASPLRIVVLLFEGAIRFIRQAEEHCDQVGMRGHHLGRAHRIVSELLASLDHEAGGEIAARLSALYHFVLGELTRANLEGDRAALGPVVGVLELLLDGFRQIEARPESER